MAKLTVRTVITGIGAVCPLGLGSGDFFGPDGPAHSPIVPNDRLGKEASQIPFIAPIRDFEPKKHVKPRKSIKLMSETITSAVAAGSFAVKNAQLDLDAIDLTRFGVVCGSEMMYGPPQEIIPLYDSLTTGVPSMQTLPDFSDGFGNIFPLWLLKYLPNMPACHIGIANNATGPNNSIVQGDASSLLSIAEGVTVIERGAADVMLVGGTGTSLPESWTCHLAPEAFAQATDPSLASRPFDANRNGIVAGEGTALLVIESLEHALARGATPIAEIAGFGRVFGSRTVSKPTETVVTTDAIERSLRIALESAECATSDVDHVNANAAGRKLADSIEANAIRNVLGDVPVTAPKCYFGNLGAGSGAVELIASLEAARNGGVPPTRNYDTPDPDCPVNVIVDSKPFEKDAFVKLSQSSTGQSVAFVIKRFR